MLLRSRSCVRAGGACAAGAGAVVRVRGGAAMGLDGVRRSGSGGSASSGWCGMSKRWLVDDASANASANASASAASDTTTATTTTATPTYAIPLTKNTATLLTKSSPTSSTSAPTGVTPQRDAFWSMKKDMYEIRDAEFIFRNVWNALVDKYGEENLAFPKDIMWLAGAPGSGKGVVTPKILDYRGITSPPIEVSALLTSPEAQRLKCAGNLVGDRQVVELLFEALLKPEYQSGVLVDGFPRTREQAECMKMLYDHMLLLRRKFSDTPFAYKFRRPVFHITVLYIDKDESVRRQLRRGQDALKHNEVVQATGVGELKPVRETDLNPRLAEERYRQFKSQVYESLKLIKEKFHFHFINATGTPQEINERILKELQYQSSMELGDDTFESVRRFPLASEITMNARHELVKRLDHYRARQPALFERLINVLMTEFVHIIKRQSLSGRAIIRTTNPVFSQEPIAIDMALDLLCERGYVVVLDIAKTHIPTRVDLRTGEVVTRDERVFEFQIEFPRPSIRRG